MKCPTCSQNTPDAWKKLIVSRAGVTTKYTLEAPHLHYVQFDWMHCANPECRQLIVRGHSTQTRLTSGVPEETTETWFAHPRRASRPLDPLVSQKAPELADDYAEASAILDISPRMSAVLSRGILADLLERHAGLDDYNLSDRVDKFRADTRHPSMLREHMHHFREIADFGAHTQRNDQDQIIEVDRDGAEWMLDYLERLFDYFIVSPEKDREIAAKWDENLKDAGRRPIKPLPSESDGEGSAQAAD